MAPPRSRIHRESTKWAYLLDLAAILTCVFALYHGVQAAHDLQYPYNIDLYRDIGSGQAMRDGYFGADAAYLGETIWYNPLLPALAAALGALTNAPMNLVYTQAGPLINILIPISFYFLLAQCFNRWSALLSLLALLFMDSHVEQIIGFNVYTIMLVASRTLLIMFFLTLLAWKRAAETRRWRWTLLTGVLLGITFLGHTAPALLLGVIFTLQWVFTFFSKPSASEPLEALDGVEASLYSDKGFKPLVQAWRATFLRYLVTLVIALIVSLPYTLSIIGNYQLRILNPYPNNWIPENLLIERLPSLLELQNHPLTFVALVGVIALFWQRPIVRNLFVFWLIGAVGWLAYSYASQQNPSLPRVIPPIHFYFYFEVFKFAVFGLGITSVLGLSVRLKDKGLKPLVQRMGFAAVGTRHVLPLRYLTTIILSFVVILIVASGAPTFATKFDFQRPPFPNGQWASDERIATIDWIRQHTAPTDVFLAPDGLDLPVVAPSGRKLVCIAIFWSNPYVQWETRNADRTTLLSYIDVSDETSFRALAAQYQVSYVLLPAAQAVPAFLEQVFVNSELAIYRVRGI